jgi:hypothetical protein
LSPVLWTDLWTTTIDLVRYRQAVVVDARLVAVLADRGGVVEVRDLRAAGVGRGALDWALDHGDLVRAGPGVVADRSVWAGMAPTLRHVRLIPRALRRAGTGAIVGGASAALIWGLPLFRVPDRVETTRPRSAARRERGGRTGASVGRRAWVPDDDVAEVHGVPVTSMARTVVDVARSGSGPWALAAADAARRRGLSCEAMATAVARAAGVPGVRQARWAVANSSPLPESPLESVARGVILLSGLGDPAPQVWLGDGDGSRYRVDLLVRGFRTVVEVDGRLKYAGGDGAENAWREKRRRDHILRWGYEVEPFVAADEHRADGWARDLLVAFDRARRRHGLAQPLPTPIPRSAWHGNYR